MQLYKAIFESAWYPQLLKNMMNYIQIRSAVYSGILFFTHLLLPSFIADYSALSLPVITGKVIAVKDGDTIEILHEGKAKTIRMAHIDCPEKGQPFGNAAKKMTSQKCFGQVVNVQHSNQYDRNKRVIGVVINAAGENINKELVKEGLAWHYKKYSSDEEYSRLEQLARASKKGVWSQPNPVPPWKWRNK